MSLLVEGVIAHLRAQSSITDLTGTRIRASQAGEDDDLPYVTLIMVSDPSVYHMGGASGIAQARIQIDCIGSLPLEATNVAEAIRSSISGFRGTMGTVAVRRCHKADRAGPDFFQAQDGKDKGKYRMRMDFMIDYNE